MGQTLSCTLAIGLDYFVISDQNFPTAFIPQVYLGFCEL